MDCLPWWHTKFDGVPAFTVRKSGCAVNSSGSNPCDPEELRANAEMQMRDAGFDGDLSLEAYTLARYLQSEVGTSRIEESIAVAEAAINRAKREGGSVLNVLLYRPGTGYGRYGPIHGVGTGTSTAPYGRWAATSADPSLKALLIAQFVDDGGSDDFAQGADDQDGPEYWAKQGQSSLNNYVQRLATNGKYWVGPLPGIDHWHTFLQSTPGINKNSPEGLALTQRGLEALTLPVVRPDWSELPVCSGGQKLSTGEMFWISLASIAGLAAAIYADRWFGASKSV